MAVYLSPLGGVGAQFFDNNGDPLAGGKLYSYAAGTTTPQVTYTTSSGNTPHTNPIILNSAGRVSNGGEIWLTENVNYKFILTNSNDVLLATWDNVPGINDGSNDSSLIIYDPPFANSVPTTVENKLAESVSVQDFGAVGDGVTDDTQAFVRAALASDTVYVPNGTYRIDTPFSLNPTAAYYGPATLQFDNAEWWRAGGSAGSTTPTERFTLFFDYVNQANVYCNVNGVPQPITWITDYTFEVPAPLSGASVIYGVINGTLQLGDTPEQIFSYNTFANGGGEVAPVITSPTAPTRGINNAALGPRALLNITTASNNSAFGSRALLSSTTGGNNTAVGFQALYRNTGSGNTAVGSVAGEWNVSGSFNTMLGLQAASKNTSGSYNTAVGNQALGESAAASYAVAVGYRALGNSGEVADITNNVAVGAFAGDFCRAQNNTFVGYRAGTGPNSGSTGSNNVAVGFFALRNQDNTSYSVAVGVGALSAATTGDNNVAVGHEALASVTTVGSQVAVGYRALYANTTGTRNSAFGESALTDNVTGNDNTAVGFASLVSSTSSSNTTVGARAANALTTGGGVTAIGFEAGRFLTTQGELTAVGHRAARSSTGAANTAVGFDALQLNTTGVNNTALGRSALRLDQSGNNQTNFDNTTGLGFEASVSGSNQVQLGNSATTTYVYGTVQNRSDARDKADICDTKLGLDFIMSLRPVDYRWDLREDYMTQGSDGSKTHVEKDGSKKRARFHHGFIAQEIGATKFSFGGYQDHKVNGGCDVLSLGYDEFIAPLVKAIQELTARVKELEAKC